MDFQDTETKNPGTWPGLLFSAATPQGYTLPTLSADHVLSATGSSHQMLVASFNLHLVAQSACQSSAIRLQLGIEGI